MPVTFVNASNVQPLVNAEVVVATIAGPLDNLDAYVSGGAWADGTLVFSIYATVGAVRAKVAIGIFGGPSAARITWVNPNGEPIEGSVHAGGTSYDLVVFGQQNQTYQPIPPAKINLTFAAVNEGDTVADANMSGSASAAFGGDATVVTAAGFNIVADVAARMQNAPSILFKLYASCGAGSVEALIAEASSGGPDATAAILREVSLSVATQYRLAVALQNPGSAFIVTASLSTYVSGGAGGGGGPVALVGNANGPSNANTIEDFVTSATDADVHVAALPQPTGAHYIGLNGLTNDRTVFLNPAVPTILGDRDTIKDEDGSLAVHNIILDPGAGNTIDGNPTYTMMLAVEGSQGAITVERISATAFAVVSRA